MAPAAPPFRVLYVCTGNICRSALAERLSRLRLREQLGDEARLIEVESAGVQALPGEPMDAESAAALRALGGDDAGFLARTLDADLVHAADLILTARRRHRASVVRVDASAARRTFTIKEYARLAKCVDLAALPDVDSSTRLQSLVEEVAASRGTVRPEERSDFDVEDPYGGPASLHRHVAAQIDAATTTTADLLAAAVVGVPAQAARRATTAARTPKPAGSPHGHRAAPPHGHRAAPPPRDRKVRRRRRLLPAVALSGLAVLAATAWLAWTGLSAKRELEASRPLVSQARQQVLDGDTAAAQQTVTKLHDHTARARHATAGPMWRLAEKVPFVGDDVTAIRTVTRAVDDVAGQVLPPLLATSDALRPDKLRTAGNRINLVPLETAAPTLHTSAVRSNEIKNHIDGISRQGLAAPVAGALDDVRRSITDLATTTTSAARAAELIPPMLGADGKRRYFLAFQNNAEARGTGGRLGAYGVLEVDGGRIRVGHLGPNTELTNPKRLPVDLGKDYRALYGRTPPYWVNGNVSPHFPDAGRIWTAMWHQEFDQDLDGVIATDPVGLGYLLKATGPAHLPGGGRITADNAVASTMKDVFQRYPNAAKTPVRDAYLQGVAGAVFDRLLSGHGDPKALADQLTNAAGEGRLLVYSSHQQEQRRLEQTSLAGAVPETSRPFAGLVVNNYSGSKLDYYLDRTLDYRRSSCVAEDGTTPSTIKVTLTNDAPKGLPTYVNQRLDTGSFPGRPPRGSNTEHVQVLATRGAELASATLDGKNLRVSSAHAQGHPAFAANVTLLAGQTRTIVLQLTEPPTSGAPELMKPQPLVREISQQASTQSCGNRPK